MAQYPRGETSLQLPILTHPSEVKGALGVVETALSIMVALSRMEGAFSLTGPQGRPTPAAAAAAVVVIS